MANGLFGILLHLYSNVVHNSMGFTIADTGTYWCWKKSERLAMPRKSSALGVAATTCI